MKSVVIVDYRLFFTFVKNNNIMSLVDQFDTEGYLCDEPLLIYITEMAAFHFPAVDFVNGKEELYQSFNVLYTFVGRYNENKITYNFKYENYLKNREIQDTLNALNIDCDKFWYALLFIYDLSYCKCVGGYVKSESASDQICNFINAICKNVINNDFEKNKFIEKATVTLKIGKKSIVVDNPDALIYLALNSSDIKENNNAKMNWSTIDFSVENIKSECDSKWICYFYKMMKAFFDDFYIKRPKQKKGDTISLSMLLLISRLVYFTGITKSKSYLINPNKPEDGVDGTEALKQCLKEYKNKETKTVDLVYMPNFK